MLIACAIGGLVCCKNSNNVDKNKINTKVEATSVLIRYNNKNYIVIPSDLIEKKSKYANLLDKLGFDYSVKSEYIGDCIKQLEEGASLYNTIKNEENVLILRDYNNEYSYVFML